MAAAPAPPAPGEPSLKRDKLFRSACRTGKIAKVRLMVANLVEKPISINSVDKKGNTALMMASEGGHHDVVKLLLDLKPEVHLENKSCETALIVAALNLRTRVIERLVKVMPVDAPNSLGNTPLIVATKANASEGVRSLLVAGANPNVNMDAQGRLALHWAAAKGFRNVVALLLEYGASPLLATVDNELPASITLDPFVVVQLHNAERAAPPTPVFPKLETSAALESEVKQSQLDAFFASAALTYTPSPKKKKRRKGKGESGAVSGGGLSGGSASASP